MNEEVNIIKRIIFWMFIACLFFALFWLMSIFLSIDGEGVAIVGFIISLVNTALIIIMGSLILTKIENKKG